MGGGGQIWHDKISVLCVCAVCVVRMCVVCVCVCVVCGA